MQPGLPAISNIVSGSEKASPEHNRFIHLIGICFLCLITFLAYSNSLHGIWALDDVLINQPIGIEQVIEKAGVRKVTSLTFLLNQKIDPYSPVNFRLFNILIHVVNSLLLYAIAFVTVRMSAREDRDGRLAVPVALISGAVFALHPLNGNAVAYIIQRGTALAALFVLLSLITYIFAHRAGKKLSRGALYGTTVVFIILAMLSKENGVMAIPLILLYDYVFFSRGDTKTFIKKVAIILCIGLAASLIVNRYFSVYGSALSIGKEFLAVNKPLAFKAWMAQDVYWTPLEHILTEMRVLCRYLFVFLFPLPHNLIFDWWGYPVSGGLFEPATTLFSVCLVSGAVILSFFSLRRFPFLSFGVLWYFIAISLESFLAVGSDFYFEHRNYLPLAGLTFGIVAQICVVFRERLTGRFTLWIAVAALSALLGLMTFQRNFVWRDPVTFWKDSVEKAPYNIRANLALANAYYGLSDYRNAEGYYMNAIRLAEQMKAPNFAREAFFRFGFMALLFEKRSEAGKIIDAFERLSPGSYKLNILKGYYRFINHDSEGAVETYLQVFSDRVPRTERVTLFTLMGDAYRSLGQVDEAFRSYERALELNYAFPAALHGLAKVSMLKGDFVTASHYLSRVLALDPYNIGALDDTANLLLIKGEGPKKALPFAQRAVSLNPPLYKPYLSMGTILGGLGDEGRAGGYFARAQELNAPSYFVLFNKAWACSLRGDREEQAYYLRELLNQKDVPENMRNTAHRILSQLGGKR